MACAWTNARPMASRRTYNPFCVPQSSEFGTHKTFRARFWPGLEPFCRYIGQIFSSCQALLEVHGMDADCRTPDGVTPLMLAASRGNALLVEQLLIVGKVCPPQKLKDSRGWSSRILGRF